MEERGIVSVPQHLQDANRDAEALGHGKGYIYPHESHDHYYPQQYLPDEMMGTYFYNPTSQGYERTVQERLDRWREAQRKALGIKQSEVIPDLSEDEINEVKQKHKATR